MKIVSMRCPECNAVVNPPEGRRYSYCPYCGTMYMVDDGVKRVEVTKNIHSRTENYDYARISEAEAQVKIAEQELLKDKEENRSFFFSMMLLVGLIVVAAISLGISDASSKKKKQALYSSAAEANVNIVTTLHSSGDYIDEDYRLVEQDLADRGFTNIIVTVEKSKTKPGTVYSVSINGEGFGEGESFPSDAEVVIKYRAEKLFDQESGGLMK